LSEIFLRRTKPESAAIRVRAITHRSVLLSTKTRNAPIPLVNRNKSINRPNSKGYDDCSFFFCSQANAALIAHNHKTSVNIPLRKFIIIARESADIQNRELIGLTKLNQKVI